MTFSAVLLAGGKSTRMGGDKAELLLNGSPFWRIQLDLLREAGAGEIFIAGSERELPRDSGVTIIGDAQPPGGPLSGVIAGLRRSTNPLLLVLAVDMPAMTASFLKSLVARAQPDCGLVPKTDAYEPLAAVYPTAALAAAEDCLQRGIFSMQEVVARVVASGLMREYVVPSQERPLFFNTNTPAEFAEFVATWSLRASRLRAAEDAP
ncbi:MAG: molybdenum cofactor guanylyltransferase [Chthoniobacter sp.]|jgi:molybdopterin-guanine dinucleotide biosynthesis protein A|nr:molybdenum cofactor guanylyltransferase [Chthoniobacter sp.]